MLFSCSLQPFRVSSPCLCRQIAFHSYVFPAVFPHVLLFFSWVRFENDDYLPTFFVTQPSELFPRFSSLSWALLSAPPKLKCLVESDSDLDISGQRFFFLSWF